MKFLTHLKATICLTSLLLAACGGNSSSAGSPSDPDDPNKPGQEEDDDSSKPKGKDPAPLAVSVSGEANVPGLASSAEAEVDEDASFSWSITKQPKGSTLEDSDLEGADEPSVSFHPQIQGEYELTVTATLGDRTGKKSITLDVKGYDVPFSLMKVSEADPDTSEKSATHVALMVNSGAGPVREVGCAYEVVAETLGDAGSINRRSYGTSVYLPRTPDGVARIASRVFSDDPEAGGKIEFADSTTSCDDDPPPLVELGAEIEYANFPLRFSPDGLRLSALVGSDDEGALMTIGSNGKDLHVLTGGAVTWAPHYGWLSNHELALLIRPGDEGDPYQLVYWPDEPFTTSQALLDCEDVPLEDAVLPASQMSFSEDGWLLASPHGLVHLTPDEEGNYDCDVNSEQNRIITEHVGSFDVADDWSRVVYESPLQGVFVIELDGGEPQRISPEDGAAHFQPRFALGGQQIVWSSYYDHPGDGGMGGAPPFAQSLARVHRANADGSHPFIIWQEEGPAEETVFATGGTQRGSNNDCSFAVPFGAGSSGLVALGLAGSLLLRRRRRTR